MPKDTTLAPSPKFVFGKTFIFRLRQHEAGNFNNGLGFRNLWELSLIDEKGKVVQRISDADSLPYCLENLQGTLEDLGL